MSIQHSHSEVGFKRCAVCKIDLKGRFVYIDERTEHLLGLTKEDLFGKCITDFLDEPSQKLIEQLLAQRNHYETFYDITTLTLLSNSKKHITSRVIVSLNFIAGNPVNFQMVIDPASFMGKVSHETPTSHYYDALLSEIIDLGNLSDWKPVLQILCRYVGAAQACLYLIQSDKLEARSMACNDSAAEQVFKAVPDLTEMHQRVADTGQVYSFIDGASVQRMIESAGSAPNEFVTRFEMSDGARYLFRLIFPEEFDSQQAQESIAAAKLVIRLVSYLRDARSSDREEEDDDSFDIRFTIGFLDSLGIAAFLNDSDGTIVGYNPSMLKFASRESLDSNYMTLLRAMPDPNREQLANTIADYINSEDPSDSETDLQIRVQIGEHEYAAVNVMRLGESASDRTACFVFMPEPGGATPSDTVYTDRRMWYGVMRHLRESLGASMRVSDQLSHKFVDRLGSDGNKRLKQLDEELVQMHSAVDSFARLLRMAAGSQHAETTDLNLMVNGILKKLLAQHPDLAITCTYSHLPKINARRRVLTAIVKNILTLAAAQNDGTKVTINIEARTGDQQCQLLISHPTSSLNAGQLSGIMSFDRLGLSSDNSSSSKKLHYAVTRKLIELIHGKISLRPLEQGGVIVEIDFPTT
jgi:PAS domain-containing protein